MRFNLLVALSLAVTSALAMPAEDMAERGAPAPTALARAARPTPLPLARAGGVKLDITQNFSDDTAIGTNEGNICDGGPCPGESDTSIHNGNHGSSTTSSASSESSTSSSSSTPLPDSSSSLATSSTTSSSSTAAVSLSSTGRPDGALQTSSHGAAVGAVAATLAALVAALL